MLTDRLARLLPRTVRRALRAPVEIPARWRFQRQLKRSGFRLATGGPVLSYGGAIPRAAGAVIHGGQVKLTHLDRVFPEGPTSFNLMYLVSSAIPAHAWEQVQFARERGAKLVWNQNGVAYPAWAGPFSAEVNEPMARLRAVADFVVYQSEFCRTTAERFLGPATAPAAVLFNPVDLDFFRPTETPLPLRPLRLLAAGTHTYAARVLNTLEVLAALRRGGQEAVLTVAGRLEWSGAEAELAKALEALQLREHVTFRPAFSQAEAAELYRAHHILLHPKYMDPCPTVVIEALACGLPVVGPASGGLPELVDAGSGRLIPVPEDWAKMHAPDVAAMAAGVSEIAGTWADFSRRARARAMRLFRAEDWMVRHRQIFEELVTSSAST